MNLDYRPDSPPENIDNIMSEYVNRELTRISDVLSYDLGELLSTPLIRTTEIDNTDSPYSFLSTDFCVFGDTTGGAITINLAAGIDGQHIIIKNIPGSGNNITVNPNGVELIEGAANLTVTPGSAFDLLYIASKTGWYTI